MVKLEQPQSLCLINYNTDGSMKKHSVVTVILLMLFIVLFSACSATGQYFLFGTFVDLQIDGRGATRVEKSIAEELARLENLFSPTINGSDVWRINNAKARVAVDVSADTMNALEVCKRMYELSGGAFDPTVYPLVKLWKFTGDTYTGFASAPPEKSAITDLLNYVGFDEMLELDFDNNTVAKKFEQVQIDFGGVAKGYATKVAADLAQGRNALLNLGGNVVCVGKSYTIGIRNPRESDTPYFGSMTVDDGFSVSTSGDYERFYDYEGIRYHHIINSKTGYPSGIVPATNQMAEGRLISVTIVSKDHAECDAIATTVLLLGKTEGVKLVKDQNFCAVLIDNELNYTVVGEMDFNKK